MTICQYCKEKLVFDVAIKSQAGRLIALNPGSKEAHHCTNGNGSAKPKQQETKISNFTLRPELMQIHEEAKEMCKEAYRGAFDNATEDRKMMYILHWENLICQLKCVKIGGGTT